MHQSIPTAPSHPPPAPPPRATAGHLSALAVPGVWLSLILLDPGAGHQPISGASPGLLTPTRFISLKHGEFRGQDKRFVGDWLIQQGLEKIVDVFKGIFS